MKRCFPLFACLLMLSCGRGKDCEQPTTVSANLENRTAQALTLEFVFWSTKQAKLVTKSFELPGNSPSRQKIEDSTYTKTPYYHGKIDFDPENPTCTAEPEQQGTSLYLTEASFQLVKNCLTRHNYDRILIAKTDTCPADTYEQRSAGYPNSSSTSTSTDTDTHTR